MKSATHTNGLWIKCIMTVLAITMLASCGGGSSGSSSSTTPTSSTPTTTPISTAPPVATGTIVNSYPTSGRHIAPKVVFNGAGVGLAVWESADGPIYDTNSIGRAIWYSLYQNGQWSPEVVLAAMPDTDSNGGGTSGFFQLQAAASATGFAVAWIQQDRTNSTTAPYYVANLYARVFNGTSWGSVTSIETGATPVSQPAIASNGSGYLVAWEQFNATTSVDAINVNMYSGGAWQGVTEIANSTLASYTVGNPHVASNGSGYATAWSEFNGATFFNSARIFNGSWGTAQAFTGLTGFSGAPYLESSGGNYMLAWNQTGGASTAYDSIGSGTAWSAPAGVALSGLTGLKASNAGYAAVYPCSDPVTPADTSLCGKVYAAGAWGAQVLLENVSGSNSANPVLASDGTNYGVLWRQYNATTSDYNVYYNTFTAAVAATPIQVVATKSALDGSAGISPPTGFPREAIAYDGTGYMLGWIQCVVAAGTSSSEQAYAQHYSGATAGTKSTLTTLAHDSGVHSATLTTNKAGIKLATWQQYYFDTTTGVPTYFYGLFAAATNASGVWGTPMLLSSYGNSAQVISNGSTFAIVYNYVSMNVVVRIYDPGTGTLSAQQNQSISIGYDPKIATNGTGYLMSWWETGTYPIYASIYNGTSWSVPASIGGTNGYGIPQVASNGTGYAVAWQHYDSVTAANHAYANVFNGTAWLGSQLIDTQSTAMVPVPTASSPHIAANGTGYALVWMQNSGTLGSIYASLFSGTAWSAPAVIDGQTAAALYPEVISNGTSYAVAWQQGTNCYARLWSGSWGTVTNVGACANATTNNESNLTMATDGVGYAFAFQTPSSPSYGSYAAAYSNGTWGPITGVTGAGCGGPVGPGSTGWVLRGGSGGYGVVSLCNGGLYQNFDLQGSFFHGSGWSTPALLESGAYPVGYGIDLAASGTSFTAAWTQPHESQPDPSTRKFYMRSGL
jgi:hypothetical protein